MAEPRGEVLGRVGEGPTRECGPAREVAQVGCQVARRHPGHRVARHAGARGEDALAGADGIVRRHGRDRGRGAQLVVLPLREVLGAVDDDAEPHVGVRQPAELRALSEVDAGHARHEDDAVRVAGDDVALAAELRHPEAVDHVRGSELQANGSAGGQVDLVGRHDAEPRIADLPPPLVRRDVDAERVGGRHLGLRPERHPDRRDGDREQDQRGTDRPRHLEVEALVARRRRRPLRTGARRVAEQSEHEQGAHQHEDQAVPRDHLEVEVVRPGREVRLGRHGRHRWLDPVAARQREHRDEPARRPHTAGACGAGTYRKSAAHAASPGASTGT